MDKAITTTSRNDAQVARFKSIVGVTLFVASPILLVMLSAGGGAAYAAGGLVGAAVDPAFGRANEVGMVADYGYDMARDISRVFTALSTIPAVMAGAKVAHSYSQEGNAIGNQVRAIGTGLTVAFGFPTVIHLLGIFAINNFGGLGGGL